MTHWSFVVICCISFVHDAKSAVVFIDYMDGKSYCENTPVSETPIYTLKADGDDGTVNYWVENVHFSMCNDDGSGKSTNGDVCLIEKLNREDDAILRFDVCAQDDKSKNCSSIAVAVEDENDNAPQFLNLPYIKYVYEGNSSGGLVFKVEARDADNGYSGLISFSLEDETEFELRNIAADDSLLYTADVNLKINLDFEESQIHVVNLVAQDQGIYAQCGHKQNLNTSTTLYLNVIDEPDTPPIFTKVEYNGHVAENTNKLEGDNTISARDGDYGLNWGIKYSLEESSRFFKIDENTGELSVTNPVDRESDDAIDGFFTLTVLATEVVPSTYPDVVAMSASTVVTITVEDVNDNKPIFYTSSSYDKEISEYVAAVAENSVNSISSLNIFVKDLDQGDNAKFDLTLEGPNPTHFSVTPTTVDSEATVTVLIDDSSVLDYETRSSLEFTIIATETTNSSSFTKATIFLNITDVNDNFPVFETADVIANVPESSSVGTIVTTITVSDADSDKSVSFSLMPADPFGIYQNGTVYVAAEGLDRELRSEYYLTVRAEDNGGLVNTTQLTISIEDINDNPPVFQPDQYAVNWVENEESLSPVAVYALDLDEIGNENSNLSIQFVDDNMNAQYAISQTNTGGSVEGEIRPRTSLDAEAMNETCENDIVKYSIGVIVFDNGDPRLDDTVDITVYFQDVNDHKPEFEYDLYNGLVAEESLRDTMIANISASDDDKCPPNNEIVYTVGADFADKFSIVQSSSNSYGTLVVRNERLDRDEQGMYDVIVYAVDNGQPRKTGNATVKVTITDINNKFPVFNNTLSDDSVSVFENATADETITVLVADDSDLDSDLIYEISHVSCQDENGVALTDTCDDWFEIETIDQTGHIQVKANLDRETAERVTLVVKVNDMNAEDGEQTDFWTIEILILDVNDNPPEFSAIPDFSVIEEVDSGTIVGQISATDPDKGQAVTFSTENDYINITESGELSVAFRIDREGRPGNNFTAVIFATDDGDPRLTSNATFQFFVTDTNDFSPSFDNETYECSVKEEDSSGAIVCTVSATDNDIGNNAMLCYSIQSDGNFDIDPSSGVISTTSVRLDRETLDVYEVVVTVTDNAGEQSRTADAQVTISITDIDDHVPTYKDFATQNMEIEEEEKPEALIGEVERAKDGDTEEFQKNYYFLVYKEESNAREHFRLNMTTRELFATTELDREERNFYELYVLTTKNLSYSNDDYSTDDENAILTINISVLDINDNSPQFTSSRYTGDLQVDKQPSENDVILAVRATDEDEGVNSELTYSISSQTVDGMFSIGSSTGNIYLLSAIEGVVGDSFDLELLVTDGGDLVGEASAVIRLFDIDETIVLQSRLPVDYLNENKDELEKDLEAALDADVVIDSILPHTTEPVARAETDGSIQSDIYFHASSWNDTALIPAEEVIIELDSSQNTEVLIKYGIVAINDARDDLDVSPTDETDLLKAILVVACCLCIVVLIVYTIAFVLMRRRYQRKLKAEAASANAFQDMLPSEHKTGAAANIPNTNMNRTGENPLMLENQKGNIDFDQWLRSQESNDDNNSIDDNAVDSQDSAISADPRDTTDFSQTNEFDNLDDADIDFDDPNVANLAAALNARRGGDEIVLAFDNEVMDHTAM